MIVNERVIWMYLDVLQLEDRKGNSEEGKQQKSSKEKEGQFKSTEMNLERNGCQVSDEDDDDWYSNSTVTIYTTQSHCTCPCLSLNFPCTQPNKLPTPPLEEYTAEISGGLYKTSKNIYLDYHKQKISVDLCLILKNCEVTKTGKYLDNKE